MTLGALLPLSYVRARTRKARETRHVFLVEHVHRDWPVNISTTRNALSHRRADEAVRIDPFARGREDSLTK